MTSSSSFSSRLQRVFMSPFHKRKVASTAAAVATQQSASMAGPSTSTEKSLSTTTSNNNNGFSNCPSRETFIDNSGGGSDGCGGSASAWGPVGMSGQTSRQMSEQQQQIFSAQNSRQLSGQQSRQISETTGQQTNSRQLSGDALGHVSGHHMYSCQTRSGSINGQASMAYHDGSVTTEMQKPSPPAAVPAASLEHNTYRNSKSVVVEEPWWSVLMVDDPLTAKYLWFKSQPASAVASPLLGATDVAAACEVSAAGMSDCWSNILKSSLQSAAEQESSAPVAMTVNSNSSILVSPSALSSSAASSCPQHRRLIAGGQMILRRQTSRHQTHHHHRHHHNHRHQNHRHLATV